MNCLPVRLSPGSDLRRSLEREASVSLGGSAFVVAGIGSLAGITIRLAASAQETRVSGAFELISLSGSLSLDGAHLHMSVADESGRVIGGHVCYGNIVRTTAEVLLVALEAWQLSRSVDPDTGYRELQVGRAGRNT